MRRAACGVLVLCAALGIVGRAGAADSTTTTAPQPSGAPTAAAPPAGWSPTALRTAEDLAKKIAASSIGCAEYVPWTFDSIAKDFKESGLPIPAAVSRCTAAEDEDLTFEVFVDEQHEEQFVTAKLALICKAAANANMQLAFTYVDGPAWIVEPDEKETTDELARLLGATSRQRTCSNASTSG